MTPSEDATRDLLRKHGLPVPEGAHASSAKEAARVARTLGEKVVVRPVVPSGNPESTVATQRIPAGNVEAVAAGMLACQDTKAPARGVYVERAIDIVTPLGCKLDFADRAPRVTVFTRPGAFGDTPEEGTESVISAEFDPLAGLRTWEAIELWSRAGLSGRALAEAGRFAARLWKVFTALDAEVLDARVFGLDADQKLWLTEMSLEIDDFAVTRQKSLADLPDLLPVNPRERAVAQANRSFPGGDARYVELDGDIGLFVAGGGAGLVQHDLVRDLGGRPANHSDISPAPGTEKMEAVLDAIFCNPRVRSLLVGWNFLQMAPCDKVIEALLRSVERNRIDTTRFPMVIRLFGPRENEARTLAARLPGVSYLPRSASLAEGARIVVDLTRGLSATGGKP